MRGRPGVQVRSRASSPPSALRDGAEMRVRRVTLRDAAKREES